ncbi:MAG TPA: calcium-binding protein [Conexibacter sp.]|nr:calcium-binding protein [Conexibacter sp.]
MRVVGKPWKGSLALLVLAAAWMALALAGPAAASDDCPVQTASAGRHVIQSDGDEPVMKGTAASDLICGDDRANVIIGGLLDDEIYGGGGADILIGGHGTDLLNGGAGSDWLRGGDGQDCYQAGAESETTTDTVSFADATPTNEVPVSGVVVDLTAPDATVEVIPPSCDLHDAITPAPGRALGQGPNEELNGIDRIIGSAFNDNIRGGSGRVTIDGGFGDDVLNGVGGDDSLTGEEGSDTCTNDGSAASCSDGQGLHRPRGAIAFAQNRNNADFGLVVLGAEGTTDDTLEVSRSSETRLHVTANSSLSVAARCTAVSGGADCELSTARYVVVWGDGGNDTITTAGNLSTDQSPGTVDDNGGPGNDILTSYGSDDVLFTGEGGVDRLTGNGGSDALISEGDLAGSGGDILDAGRGSDQLVTDNACAGHTLIGGEDRDIIGFARQTQVGGVRAGVRARLGDETNSYTAVAIDESGATIANCRASTMVAGTEVLEGTNQSDDLTGNGSENSLWGRKGDDVIHGLGGNDVVKGQAGNDHLFGEAGADEVYGQDGIDVLFGGNDNDIVNGGEEDDEVSGNEGEDTVTGDGGLDALFGGGGADLLLARDEHQDRRVDCGEGTDEARNDGNDPLVACERHD